MICEVRSTNFNGENKTADFSADGGSNLNHDSQRKEPRDFGFQSQPPPVQLQQQHGRVSLGDRGGLPEALKGHKWSPIFFLPGLFPMYWEAPMHFPAHVGRWKAAASLLAERLPRTPQRETLYLASSGSCAVRVADVPVRTCAPSEDMHVASCNPKKPSLRGQGATADTPQPIHWRLLRSLGPKPQHPVEAWVANLGSSTCTK